LDFKIKLLNPAFLGVGVLCMIGCATYQSKVSTSLQSLKNRNFTAALAELKPRAEEESKDQLVYLLDYAVALQLNGQISESNKAFIQADRLADQLDYHSITKQTASVVLNEEQVQYKGDTFEKVFINAYLAMNFLQIGELDSALVEARRLNEKYLKYRSDDKKAFELNFFGKYLSALIWEADRKWDDAYIAYEEAAKIDSTVPILATDLIRSAKGARRMEQYEKWKKTYPDVQENPRWFDRSYGELIVIYQQGWGPKKDFADGSYRMPTLRPVYNHTQRLRLDVRQPDLVSAISERVYDVDAAAIKTLQDDYGALAAKRIGSVVAKEVLADQVRQKNELLGFFTAIALHASDRADLRNWSTLPSSIQIIRTYLKPGEHQYSLVGLDSSQQATPDMLVDQKVKIQAGKKTFVIFRSLE
jgi:hypothetical protein